MDKPYRYWTSMRIFTTSNAQMPPAEVPTYQSLAVRSDTDTAMRSIWWAEVSYRCSNPDGALEGWWSAAWARLVINFDPLGSVEPSDISEDNPATMGFADLQPRYVATPTAGHYVVQWESPPQGLDLHGARAGYGDGTKPGVLASMFLFDQNGVWGGSADPTAQRRLRIAGRVLWATDIPAS